MSCQNDNNYLKDLILLKKKKLFYAIKNPERFDHTYSIFAHGANINCVINIMPLYLKYY